MLNGIKNLFGRVVATNVDNLNKDEQSEVLQEILKHSDIPAHKGEIEHGYSLSKVRDPAKCPLCAALTEVRYANFIYRTQKGTRVMMAPAGHFCTRCATVVVNEALLEKGASRGYIYSGVIGVEGENNGPFRTWNGREVAILFDEENNDMQLVPLDELSFQSERAPSASSKDKRKAARRRELAKASRKRNRRK